MTMVTQQTPMTVEEVFDGYDFRTNQGREGTRYFFNGHLSPREIAERYYGTYPEHRSDFPHLIDPSSVRHAWHVFTEHEDTCYLIADADDPFDPDTQFLLCTCKALQAHQYDGRGYEYRHPHEASAGVPGAVPVTWVSIGTVAVL